MLGNSEQIKKQNNKEKFIIWSLFLNFVYVHCLVFLCCLNEYKPKTNPTAKTRRFMKICWKIKQNAERSYEKVCSIRMKTTSCALFSITVMKVHTHTQGKTKQIPMPRSMYNELHGHETTSTTFCTHNFLTIAMNSNNYLLELLGEWSSQRLISNRRRTNGWKWINGLLMLHKSLLKNSETDNFPKEYGIVRNFSSVSVCIY